MQMCLSPKPIPYSSTNQKPAAVLARIQAWLIPSQGVRDAQTHGRMACMLVARMKQPELSTEQLQAAAGLGWRMSLELLTRGLTVRERRGGYFYHRLTRAAEDTLPMLVITKYCCSPNRQWAIYRDGTSAKPSPGTIKPG